MSGEDPISPDANPAGVIAWPSTAIKTNIGGNYDPATGLYTAPYDGTYSFHANIYKNQGAGDGVFCSIVRGDGTTLAFANVPSILGFLVGTGSTIVHLDQGDTVVLGCTNVNYVNGFSSWMGYPVMAD